MPAFFRRPRACSTRSRRRFLSSLSIGILVSLLAFLISLTAIAQSANDEEELANSGPLDIALPGTVVDKRIQRPAGRPARAPARAPNGLRPDRPGAQGAASLRSNVRREQDTLERLPRPALNARARRNERGAQIALGVSFAKEAALLGFSVAAANEASSDAARWYSRAASQGFPGAPSLDIAGVRHYPIRAARQPLE